MSNQSFKIKKGLVIGDNEFIFDSDTTLIPSGDLNTTATDVVGAINEVESSVGGFDARITTNAGDISTNSGLISTNAGDISTNAGDISTIQGDIGDVSSLVTTSKEVVGAINELDTDITNLDAFHGNKITTLSVSSSQVIGEALGETNQIFLYPTSTAHSTHVLAIDVAAHVEGSTITVKDTTGVASGSYILRVQSNTGADFETGLASIDLIGPHATATFVYNGTQWYVF